MPSLPSAYIGPERQLAQFAGGPWTILWRMQNVEGQGPYCGLHPETGERLSRVMDVYTSDNNRHPGPAGDLTEELFHYWSDRFKERTQFLFGFADLQSAHEWFNEQEREDLLKDGFWLQMVAARHVIRSISGKQVAFIAHSNREWTGPKPFVPEKKPYYITTAQNYLTQATYAEQELRIMTAWVDGKIPVRAPEGPYSYYSVYSPGDGRQRARIFAQGVLPCVRSQQVPEARSQTQAKESENV